MLSCRHAPAALMMGLRFQAAEWETRSSLSKGRRVSSPCDFWSVAGEDMEAAADEVLAH